MRVSDFTLMFVLYEHFRPRSVIRKWRNYCSDPFSKSDLNWLWQVFTHAIYFSPKNVFHFVKHNEGKKKVISLGFTHGKTFLFLLNFFLPLPFTHEMLFYALSQCFLFVHGRKKLSATEKNVFTYWGLLNRLNKVHVKILPVQKDTKT